MFWIFDIIGEFILKNYGEQDQAINIRNFIVQMSSN